MSRARLVGVFLLVFFVSLSVAWVVAVNKGYKPFWAQEKWTPPWLKKESGGGGRRLSLDVSGVRLAVPTIYEIGRWMPRNDSFAQWFEGLPVLRAGEIQWYIDWLWEKMSGKGNYTMVFSTPIQWHPPPKPRPEQTVKAASYRLWCGARLDILAYVDPRTPSRVNLVVYGGIENMTEYMVCMGYALAVHDRHGFLPGFLWGLRHGLSVGDHAYLDHPTKLNKTLFLWRLYMGDVGVAVHEDDAREIRVEVLGKTKDCQYVKVVLHNYTTPWICLFDERLPDYLGIEPGFRGNTTVRLYESGRQVHAWLVLEEPQLTRLDFRDPIREYLWSYPGLDSTWWTLVGYPAFSIVANTYFTDWSPDKYWETADWAALTARRVVLTGVGYPDHPPRDFAYAAGPTSIRHVGVGICATYSVSTAIFVDSALLLPALLLDLERPQHLISYVYVPSSSGAERGEPIFIDYDGDGVEDRAVMIYDTARTTREHRVKNVYGVTVLPPTGFTPYPHKHGALIKETVDDPPKWYAVNPLLYEYVEMLPRELRAPWQDYVLHELNATWALTWIRHENRTVTVTADEYMEFINRRLRASYLLDIYGNKWPLGIYNKTPEEIVEAIDRLVWKHAKIEYEIFREEFDNDVEYYAIAIADNRLLWGGKIHWTKVPLHIAARAYAIALAQSPNDWPHTPPPPPPVDPHTVPGSMDQAAQKYPHLLEWDTWTNHIKQQVPWANWGQP